MLFHKIFKGPNDFFQAEEKSEEKGECTESHISSRVLGKPLGEEPEEMIPNRPVLIKKKTESNRHGLGLKIGWKL